MTSRIGPAAAVGLIAAILAASAAAVTSARVVPQRRVAQAGATRAVVLYQKLVYRGGISTVTNPRVRISRDGREVFAEAVPIHPAGRRRGYTPRPSVGVRNWFVVRDLDGDGEPEVVLELDWGGTHCCGWARVYQFEPSRRTLAAVNHWWGNGGSVPSLRDVDRDGRPEFVSSDDRFTALVSYASSVEPIQIWSFRGGRFRDVTRRHRSLVRRDAADLWRSYLADRGRRSVRYVLAAWAADQYMLGRPAAVDRAFARALQRGDLTPRLEDRPRDPVAFLRMLKRFLRTTGYVSG